MKKQKNHQQRGLTPTPTPTPFTTDDHPDAPPSLSTISLIDCHRTDPTAAMYAGKASPFKKQLGTRENHRNHKNQWTTRRGVNEGKENGIESA